MPSVGGAQWFLQVRSPKSAEEFRFAVDLPDGETLRADEASGGVALERDGRAVGAILAPSARDAQGRPVEVSYAVEGKTVVVKVAHRGLDVVYPLVVDPEVRPGFDWRCAGGPCSGDAVAAGWAAGSQGGPYTAQGGPYFTVCGFNPGLCLRSNPGSFTGTASAWWSYASIRQSYVYRAYFGSIHLTAADAQECVQVGILNGYFWQGTTFRCSYSRGARSRPMVRGETTVTAMTLHMYDIAPSFDVGGDREGLAQGTTTVLLRYEQASFPVVRLSHHIGLLLEDLRAE